MSLFPLCNVVGQRTVYPLQLLLRSYAYSSVPPCSTANPTWPARQRQQLAPSLPPSLNTQALDLSGSFCNAGVAMRGAGGGGAACTWIGMGSGYLAGRRLGKAGSRVAAQAIPCRREGSRLKTGHAVQGGGAVDVMPLTQQRGRRSAMLAGVGGPPSSSSPAPKGSPTAEEDHAPGCCPRGCDAARESQGE